jgi:hypothetical protein
MRWPDTGENVQANRRALFWMQEFYGRVPLQRGAKPLIHPICDGHFGLQQCNTRLALAIHEMYPHAYSGLFSILGRERLLVNSAVPLVVEGSAVRKLVAGKPRSVTAQGESLIRRSRRGGMIAIRY